MSDHQMCDQENVPKNTCFTNFVCVFWHYFVQHAYIITWCFSVFFCVRTGRGATAVNQIFTAWHFVKYSQYCREPFCEQRLMGLKVVEICFGGTI